MEKNEALKKLRYKIEEVIANYGELQKKVSECTNPLLKEHINNSFERLHKLRCSVYCHYITITESKKERNSQMNFIESNIYMGIESLQTT